MSQQPTAAVRPNWGEFAKDVPPGLKGLAEQIAWTRVIAIASRNAAMGSPKAAVLIVDALIAANLSDEVKDTIVAAL